MIKRLLRKIAYGPKADSDSYIRYLRGKGISIGEDCTIYGPHSCTIDVQYPWMISIGNNVKIAQGVVLLTHDFAWSVLKTLRGPDVSQEGIILGASGKISIGNNVFIGVNTIICRNVTIGNNVIIGTGSIVTKDCPDNGVYAGNPAKYIMSIDEYYKKRYQLQLEEAKLLATEYYMRFHQVPDKKIFHEYFMLFSTPSDALTNKCYNQKLQLCGNYSESYNYMQSVSPKFASFEDFLLFCFGQDMIKERI